MSQFEFTVVWYGPVFSATGHGTVSREYVLALHRAGVNVAIVPCLSDERSNLDHEDVAILELLLQTPVTGPVILVLHVAPSHWRSVVFENPSYVLGLAINETDRIPRNWVEACNRKDLVDEVWVPTSFNMSAFIRSGVIPSRIRIVHYAIRSRPPRVEAPPSPPFRFLYVADLSPRKNAGLLLDAFIGEFGDSTEVELLLHLTSARPSQKPFLDQVRGIVSTRPNVRLSTEKLPENDLRALIASAGLYITVDRANGWGIPVLEAMALGVPTSTVDWSGSTEFAKPDNSFLMKPKCLVEIDATSAAYEVNYIGQRWAEVETSEVRRVLRAAFSDPMLTGEFGSAGRRTVEARFESSVVTDEILRILNALPLRKNSGETFTIRKASRSRELARQLSLGFVVVLDFIATYHNLRVLKVRLRELWFNIARPREGT